MNISKCTQNIKTLIICSTILLLNGCHNALLLMHPKGQIGYEERTLILIASIMMSIVIIPVLIMTIIFVIKYRASKNKSLYTPDWSHSKIIEITIWTVPIIIVTTLAFITWQSTHKLDPNKPIKSINKPITIEVVALDWKWLFIYPKYNIAVINEIVFPRNTPITFKITSNSVMNSFFIPQLGGQIYAMAGMNSTLNLIANIPGKYKGISSNFSGKGFSNMKFSVITTTNENEFFQWIQKVKTSKNKINTIYDYENIALPTDNHPITYFSNVPINLFHTIMNKFI